MDAYAESSPLDEIMIEIAGRTLPVEFRSSTENPLWLGDAAESGQLFHWSCRLGGDAPIEFHHTQSWPDFDAATALGCLVADAEDVRAAGSLPVWIERCGFEVAEAGEMRGRLGRVYEFILGYLPSIQNIIAPPARVAEPSFAG